MLRNTVDASHAGEMKQMACGEMLCVMVLVRWSWLLVLVAAIAVFSGTVGEGSALLVCAGACALPVTIGGC